MMGGFDFGTLGMGMRGMVAFWVWVIGCRLAGRSVGARFTASTLWSAPGLWHARDTAA